jgi:hypothetical protein
MQQTVSRWLHDVLRTQYSKDVVSLNGAIRTYSATVEGDREVPTNHPKLLDLTARNYVAGLGQHLNFGADSLQKGEKGLESS